MSIDLSECDREPICHLGLIQPHGYLLAINADGEITHVSENIGQLFPIAASDTLGRSLEQVLGPNANRLLQQAASSLPGQIHHQIWDGTAERYSLSIHERVGKYIFEWEPLGTERAAPDNREQTLAAGLAEIRAIANIHPQTKLAAELVAELTGYDRVMIYQFHPGWSGEVIAEVRHSQAEPFLGLHYPASDIPAQARLLYTETLLRVLVDVYGTPVGILSLPGDSIPLDLTFSQLRSPSRFHIEYLKNMKVGATTTASLICNGALWGLIACHHDRRKSLPPSQRKALGEIAQTLRVGIETAIARGRRLSVQRLNARETALQAAIAVPENALNALLFGTERVRNLLHSCGTAIWSPKTSLRMGDTPAVLELEAHAASVLRAGEDIVAIESRSDLIAALGPTPSCPALAGLIAIVVSRHPPLLLFSFRLEAIREVIWGGDINNPVLRDEQTGAISPRRSFAHYKQNTLGRAAPWTAEDLATAQVILRVLRRTAPTPEQMSQLVDVGFAAIRQLATNDHPLSNSVLDAIDDGIFLVCRSGSSDATLRYANQSLLDLAETCSEASAPLPATQDLLESIGLPADLLAQCELAPQQIVLSTPQHGLRHFLVEKKLALEVTDQQGTVGLSAILFTDTTRLERGREAFQAAEERAKHLAFLKSAFLANMSHEIRTPMNGILGMVQLLRTTHTDPQQRKYLDVMQRSGDAMLEIINDILDLAKIEAGKVDLETAPFDLALVVEGVLDLLRPQTQSKSIAISAVYDDSPPLWYMGDSLRLRQVLLNIAGNAVKFTQSGHVLFNVKGASAQPSGSLTIIVSDTGIGIPAEQLPFVFDKFHQADPSTTRKHGGTGLGLAISRELVELMGGTLSLSSTVGVGSIFTVSLPLKRAGDQAPARATDRPSAPTAPGAGRRILVAEDDPTNQIVIEGMLQTQGFEVDVASSGLQVLKFLGDRHYDLILMDCHMPDLDGYQTTERIRSDPGPQRRVPIVAVTASVMAEDRQRCLHSGMDDYMSKPFDMETLWALLRKWNCLPAENQRPPQ